MATDAGLITPIVKDVPNKSLDQIFDLFQDLSLRFVGRILDDWSD